MNFESPMARLCSATSKPHEFEFMEIVVVVVVVEVVVVVVLLSQRESSVTVKIFESKILMNFDVFEVPESE